MVWVLQASGGEDGRYEQAMYVYMKSRSYEIVADTCSTKSTWAEGHLDAVP